MTSLARVETVAVIDMRRVKPDIEYVDVTGIGQVTGGTVFLQHVAQDRIIGLTDEAMKLLSTLANRAVTRVDIIRIFK